MTSETKFTAGPWEMKRAKWSSDDAYDYGVAAKINGRNYCIAETYGRVWDDIFPQAEFNAHLIAAAPELYEALERALPFLADHVALTAGDRGLDFDPRDRMAHDQAEAALKKARGEK